MHIDERLANWSRHYRPGFVRSVCGSIEGKLYRAPWRQWVEVRDIHLLPPVDWRDAELVERAWRGMLGKHKLLLKYTYMTLFPPWVVAVKSGVKRHHLERELQAAKMAIERGLDRLQEEAYKAHIQVHPVAVQGLDSSPAAVRPKEPA